MARPVDLERRRLLLDAAVDYVIEHGLSGLSLRPLATALGTDAPVLLHHFGTKEDLVVAVLNGVRRRLRAQAEVHTGAAAEIAAVWRWSADPGHDALFRTFFEAYGMALHRPDRYTDFLQHVVVDWLDQLQPELGAARATLALAAVRGLLLDLLTTGDRERVEDAAELLTGWLDHP